MPGRHLAGASKHGDRQGRHYYTTLWPFSGRVVATLAVAMFLCPVNVADKA